MTLESEPSKLRQDTDAPAELVAAPPIELPQGFAFVSLLGEGATSYVVKARHLLTERDSAVKIMKGESCLNEVATERFKREAQVLASLDHKHIHKILGFGLTPKDSHPYIVSEFLEGQTLDQKLKTQKMLPANDFKTIFLQLAQALEYLHSAGIVHRDVKPSNIFLSTNIDGELSAKFIDFGLAKILEDGEAPADQKLTRTGTIMGSPSYMSPEQCAGKPADERSDFYSLACVMYECLSGAPPLDGAGPMDTMYRHMMEEPEPLNKLRGKEQAEPLEALVMRMLAKDPAARPQKSAELLVELSQSMTGKHFEKMLRAAPARPSKRMPAWMFIAGSLLVLLCGAAAMKSVIDKRATKAVVPVQMQSGDAWQQIREAYRCCTKSLEVPKTEALKLINEGESLAGQALRSERAQPHPRVEILYCANYMLGMLLAQKADLLKDSTMTEQALNRFSAAADAAVQPSGERYPESGGAFLQLGEVYLKKGRVNEATRAFAEAATLMSDKNMNRPGQKHMHLDTYSPGKLTPHDFPRAEYREGCCLWLTKNEAEGERLHRQAISDYNARGCAAEQDVMECWANILEHYANTGRPEKARAELAAIDKALADFESTTAKQTKVLAAANLAVARHCLAVKDDIAFNRMDESIKHTLEAARLIDVAEPGMMRSTTGATLQNSAKLCRKLGRTKDAETLEKRAAELTAYKD